MRLISFFLLPSIVLGLLLSISACAQAPITDVGTQDERASAPDNSSYPVGGSDGNNVDNAGSLSSDPNGGYAGDSVYRAESPVSAPSAVSPADQGVGVVSNIDNATLYRKVQQLEQDTQALRGLVEEQGHALQQLEQKVEEKAAHPDREVAAVPKPGGAVVADGSVASGAGKSEYEAAYNKLKAKDYNAALAGFKAVTAQYPKSDYAGSAYFWQGFVYQTKGDTGTAVTNFSKLIEDFPNHAKTPDAKYNLGKILYLQGDKTKAKALLKSVATGNSKAAPLAKQFLDTL
jgi:tol-pal system protein YbgF